MTSPTTPKHCYRKPLCRVLFILAFIWFFQFAGASPVYAADSTGTFIPHSITPSFGAGDSYDLALGDLDGDGDLDAVIANGTNAAETVWLNNGAGSFSPHPTTPSFGAGKSWAVALGDIDGDGDLDAIVSNDAVNTIDPGQTVWQNDGAGNFTAHATPSFGLGFHSFDVALGDLDGDSDLDAFVVNDGSPATVWLNNGTGVFTLHFGLPLTSRSKAVALGDIDGDSDLDAVIANDGGEAETVWLNNGAGQFTAHPTIPSFGGRDSLAVVLQDIDGDTDLDAIVANTSEPFAMPAVETTTVWRNDGTGGFTAYGAFGGSEHDAYDVALGDLDGDGDLDAVIANYFVAPETVWLNNGTGQFTAHLTKPSFGAGSSRAIALGDINGDGDLDAIVANDGTQAETVWMNRNANLSLTKQQTPSQALPGQLVTYTLSVGYTGDVTVNDAQVEDLLPAQLINPSYTATGISVTPDIGSPYTWNLGALTPGTNGTITVSVMVNPVLTAPAVLMNTATIFSSQDTTPANNSSQTQLTVNVPTVQLSANAYAVAEGSSAQITVTLDAPNPYAPVVVAISTANGSAQAPADYTAQSSTNFTIPAGQTLAVFNVPTAFDLEVEGDETFALSLAAVAGAKLGSVTNATVTIHDVVTMTDLALHKSAAPNPVIAGGGSENLTFVVTATNAGPLDATGVQVHEALQLPSGVTVDNVQASTGSYVAPNWMIPSLPVGGQAVLTLKLTVGPEASGIVSNTASVTAADQTRINQGNDTATATATIETNHFAISDVELPEGDSGSKAFNFIVTRTNPRYAASVTVQSTDNTAIAGSDYTVLAPTVIQFAAGVISQTVTVDVLGDTMVEGTETFNVVLSNAVGGVLDDATGVGTITNDDGATISISDVTLAEGDTGTTLFTFNVTLNAAVQGGASVDYATQDGTATAGTDYTTKNGTLTFVGTAGEQQTITIEVMGDTVVEGSETFSVILSNAVGGVLGDATGVGTITDDDGATFSITDVTQDEGDTGTTIFTFNVTLNAAVQGGASVNYATQDGTATAGTDYTTKNGTLTFAGTTGEQQTIAIEVVGDSTVEDSETFNVVLSNAVGGVLGDSLGVGTIVNDDSATISINDVTLAEGDTGTTIFNFVVTLNAAVQGGASVNYTTQDDTATAGTDYTAKNGILTFVGTAGEQQTVAIEVLGDSTVESSETFNIILSNAVGGVLDDATGVGTITNDDGATISISDVTLAEGDTGTTLFTFNVTLNAAVQGGASVDYATQDGTATAGTDYTTKNGTLTFVGTAGEQQTITIEVMGDTVVEGSETFSVILSNAVGGVLGDATGVGTIDEDDSPTTPTDEVNLYIPVVSR